MLTGTHRRTRPSRDLPASIPALLRDRGIGSRRNDLAVRLVDRQTDPISTASYAELYERSLAVALALRQSGVGRGDAVMLLCESRIELYYGLFGAMILGARPVAVYPPLSTATLASTLAHLRDIVDRLPVRAIATSQALFGVAQQVSNESAAPTSTTSRLSAGERCSLGSTSARSCSHRC